MSMRCAHLNMVKMDHRHPIVTSIEPGENWSWCYVDEVMLQLD